MSFISLTPSTPSASRNRSTTITDLPEELLEKILAHALTPPPSARRRANTAALFPSAMMGLKTKSSAAAASSSSSPIAIPGSSTRSSPTLPTSPRPRTLSTSPPKNAALLTNRALSRIGAPLALRTVHLASPAQTSAFAALLREQPALGAHVRILVLETCDMTDVHAMEVMKACRRVQELEFSLPIKVEGAEELLASDATATQLQQAFAGLYDLRRLTVRKDASAYLSCSAVRDVLSALASVIPSWTLLDTVTLAFRLPSTTSCPPLSALLDALVAAPALQTVRTCLPSMWNSSLLVLSTSQSLQRITLAPNEHAAFPSSAPSTTANNDSDPFGLPSFSYTNTHGTVDTALDNRSLWMRTARDPQHARLFALVKAGSNVAPIGTIAGGGRIRARTLAAPAAALGLSISSAPGSSTSLAPSSFHYGKGPASATIFEGRSLAVMDGEDTEVEDQDEEQVTMAKGKGKGKFLGASPSSWTGSASASPSMSMSGSHGTRPSRALSASNIGA